MWSGESKIEKKTVESLTEEEVSRGVSFVVFYVCFMFAFCLYFLWGS